MNLRPLADRVIVMNHGKVVQVGSPAELYEKPRTAFAASFLGKSNFLHRGGKTFALRPEKIYLHVPGEGKAIRAAAKQGASPAAPTIEAMTLSTSGWAASSHNPAGPTRTSTLRAAGDSKAFKRLAEASSGTTAQRGRMRSHCAARSAMRRNADSPTTSIASGCRWATSRVLAPTEPVEPRMARR